MPKRDLDALNRINDVVGKIAIEIALAQPNHDFGLLPVNCLLIELREAAPKLPAEINPAVTVAVAIVDRIFETTATFDETSIKQLSCWADWMTNAILDTLNERPPKRYGGAFLPKTATPAAPRAEAELLLDLAGDAELLAEFCAESHEHLQNIEQGALILENEPDNAETLSTLFRAFHTFKGGAGLLNLRPIRELAHELETVLDLARTNKLTVNRAIIDLILAGGDALKRFIDEISAQTRGKNAGAEICVPTHELLARVRVVSAGGKPAAAPHLTHATAAPAAATKPAPAERNASGKVINVDSLKLDSLIDLVGEMVIAQSLIGQDEHVTAIESKRLHRNLARLGRISKDLQHNAMSLRMVPIRATFQKMTRLVRDVSTRLNKRAELILHGEDTELDRTLVEEISDPLIHMIHNSVDHGIEKPADRVKAGKNPVGTIILSASHQRGGIVIQLRDDGRGLHSEKLKATAIERGILDEKNGLTDREAHELIFATGFSTADVVTDISGRGVGMDVVRRNIEKLRGKIGIESAIGKGTIFTVHLPLTMAIIDGLIVTIGEQRFILPTLSVRESFRPTRELITTVHEKGELVNVRGQLTPLLRPYEFYGLRPRTTDPTEALLVVAEHNGEARCLVVDQLIGLQEVVITSLGETFKNSPAIAGGCILGDGRVGLIIDTPSLVSLHHFGKALAA